MAPNTHRSIFLIRHFVRTDTDNAKTTGHIYRRGLSTYRMNALLSEMFIFCDKAVCEIQLGSKHASQSVFGKPCVRAYMHGLKTTGSI